MPHPDSTESDPDFIRRIFRSDIGAEVPPIRLSRDQWRAITEILTVLADIGQEVIPERLPSALIQGSLLAESVRQALILKNDLQLQVQRDNI
jgi:hypothetical protein